MKFNRERERESLLVEKERWMALLRREEEAAIRALKRAIFLEVLCVMRGVGFKRKFECLEIKRCR